MKYEEVTTKEVHLTGEQLIRALKRAGVLSYVATTENTVMVVKCDDGSLFKGFVFKTRSDERKHMADSLFGIEFKVEASASVHQCIAEAQGIAKTYNHDVDFFFNGIPVTVGPSTSMEEALEQWHSRRKRDE